MVDETGGQTVVFGRRGARPFHIDEMRPFLKHANGDWYKVENVKVGKDKKLFTASGVELVDPFPPPPPAKPAGIPGVPQPEPKLQIIIPEVPSTLPTSPSKPDLMPPPAKEPEKPPLRLDIPPPKVLKPAP